MSFVSSFLSAADTPIVKSIVWPPSLSHDHPLRKLSLFTRFWPVAVQTLISDSINADAKGWVEKTFHYTIASTICDEKGVPVFNEIWPQIWKDHVEATDLLIAKNTSENRAALPPLPPLPIPDTLGQYDERNQLVIPPPDFMLIGAWLKDKYSSRQGQEILGILWDAAMDYNGFKAESAKNSETTETSTPSTAVQ